MLNHIGPTRRLLISHRRLVLRNKAETASTTSSGDGAWAARHSERVKGIGVSGECSWLELKTASAGVTARVWRSLDKMDTAKKDDRSIGQKV